MAYRLTVKIRGRWRVGIKSYGTLAEAEQARKRIIALGNNPKNVRVKPEEEIFMCGVI